MTTKTLEAPTEVIVEITPEEAIKIVEAKIADVHAAAAVAANVATRIAALHEKRKKELRDITPAEIQRKRQKIERDATKAIEAVQVEADAQAKIIDDLKAEMKPLVVDVIKASVKHEDYGTASFVKGRDTADIPKLKGLAVAIPEILELLGTGDPSMRLTLKG